MTAFALTAVVGAGQTLDSLISPGPLATPHAELAGLRNCVSCHAPGRGVTDEKCLTCHDALRERVVSGRGFHRDKSECVVCHRDHQGESFELVSWNPEELNHEETGYRLEGLHRDVERCEACHLSADVPSGTRSYFLNDVRCVACHEDVHRGRLGEDCSSCHTMTVPFPNIDFDHGATAFRLVGAHERLSCETCHADQRWRGFAFSTCTDCHRDPHEPSLGRRCTSCHNERSWTTYSVDHERTRFPLMGEHVGVECESCHRGKVFRGLEFDTCGDCHADDTHFGQFEQDCGSCHTVDGFEIVSIDHDGTRYPLTGRHSGLACEACHETEVDATFPTGSASAVRYRPIATRCESCHLDPHFGQFDETCESCHVTEGFELQHSRFEHDRDAAFPLAGRHQDVDCERCHATERFVAPDGVRAAVRYKPLSDRCRACHDNVHDESWWTKSTATLATECMDCHDVDGFERNRFDHDATAFALTGAHDAVECVGCHEYAVTGGRSYILFRETSTECIDCHRSPHLRGMERCLECHGTSTWTVGI